VSVGLSGKTSNQRPLLKSISCSEFAICEIERVDFFKSEELNKKSEVKFWIWARF
jgi:hypothetical protein